MSRDTSLSHYTRYSDVIVTVTGLQPVASPFSPNYHQLNDSMTPSDGVDFTLVPIAVSVHGFVTRGGEVMDSRDDAIVDRSTEYRLNSRTEILLSYQQPPPHSP